MRGLGVGGGALGGACALGPSAGAPARDLLAALGPRQVVRVAGRVRRVEARARRRPRRRRPPRRAAVELDDGLARGRQQGGGGRGGRVLEARGARPGRPGRASSAAAAAASRRLGLAAGGVRRLGAASAASWRAPRRSAAARRRSARSPARPLGRGHALGGELGAARRALGGGAQGGRQLAGAAASSAAAAARAAAARRALGAGRVERRGVGRRGAPRRRSASARAATWAAVGGAGAGGADARGGRAAISSSSVRGPLGGARLALEGAGAGAHLAGQVAGPVELVGHPGELLLGPAAAALGDGDPGGRVDDRPALGRRAGAERLDLPLADDRERVGADAARGERLLHVEQAARLGR